MAEDETKTEETIITTEEPETDMPAAEDTVAAEVPVAEETAAEETPVEESVAEADSAEETSAEEPAAEEAPVEEPAEEPGEEVLAKAPAVAEDDGKLMTEIIGVSFKEGGKVYYFAPEEGVEYRKGDGVIVETSRGVEYATITMPRTLVDDSRIVKPLRTVMRSATEEDTEKYRANLARKDEAMQIVREKIEKFGLDMKLLDCEFAFDGTKVVFYYSAPQRVDFRDLVKNLSGIFRMRIELRQIGIRDEIRLYGGLAPCGRECCCASCLPDLKKVSIKMAKNQGLSLNPTKISGLCGRLMCCLAYENDYYAEACVHMPKVGSSVTTPDGEGTVNSLNMLKLEVSVKIEDKAKDICTYKTYSVRDIQFDGADGYFDTLDEEPEIHEDHTEDLHVHEEPYIPEEEPLADDEFPPEEEPAAAPRKDKKKKKKKPQGKTPAPYAHMNTKQKQAAAQAAADAAAAALEGAEEPLAPTVKPNNNKKKNKGQGGQNQQKGPQGQKASRQEASADGQAPKQGQPRQQSGPKQQGQNQPRQQDGSRQQGQSGPKQKQGGPKQGDQREPRQKGQNSQKNAQGGQKEDQPGANNGGQGQPKKNKGQNNGSNVSRNPQGQQNGQAPQGGQQGQSGSNPGSGKPRNKKKHSGGNGPKPEGGSKAADAEA
ncbi:MAG: hypothetical protein LUD50_05205 [Clostridia bacterium]|nr:hypothetical protein [Clostridia bacterium]